jgi:hypothetical protein
VEWRAERDRLLTEHFPQRAVNYLANLQSKGIPVTAP